MDPVVRVIGARYVEDMTMPEVDLVRQQLLADAAAEHARLQGEIDGKAPIAHTHAYADITGKPSTFPPATHTHSYNDLTDKPTLPAGNTLVGTTTIAESGLTLLAISVRRVTVAVSGAVVGGNYTAFPVNALPAGFGIVDAICTTANQIVFGLIVPIITGSYSIPVRVVRVNT